MSDRAGILAALQAARPAGDFPLPELPDFPPLRPGSDLEVFAESVSLMGGRIYEGDAAAPLPEIVAALFPAAGRIVLPGTLNPAVLPNSLDDVDVAVVRAAFGVAETGSVLLTGGALAVRALGYLAQHLVVLLDPAAIVPTLGAAYRRPELHTDAYAAFHSGPSATADIEGVLIRGAQGVRSLTVVLQPLGKRP